MILFLEKVNYLKLFFLCFLFLGLKEFSESVENETCTDATVLHYLMSSNDNDGKIDTQRTRIVNNNGCIQTPAGPKHLFKTLQV